MASSGLLESIGSASMMCIVLLTLSSPIIYAGWKNRNRFQKLSSVNTNFRKCSIDDPVAISKEIKDTSKLINSPFRSKNCCISIYDICTLRRRGTLGVGFVWSQECIGIRGDEIVIGNNGNNISVNNLSHHKTLNTNEKIKRTLVSDSTNKFSSIEMELENNNCFEDKIEPTEDTPVNYSDFIDNTRFKRPTKESYNFIGRIFRRLRTPSDTTRHREKVFQVGDHITVLGTKSRNGVSFSSSESIDPLISSKPMTEILRKYRMSYIMQLYIIPLSCILFSAILGYGAYI